MKYFNVLYVVLLTVFGQLIVKWRMTFHKLPTNDSILKKYLYLALLMLKDPFLLIGLFSAFIASLVWMSIIGELKLNIADPIMSLSFVLVFICSILFFHEKTSLLQVSGLLFIILGVSLIGLSAN